MPRALRGLFGRESIASAFGGLLLLLVAMVASACAWWAVRADDRASRRAAEQRVQALADMLALSAEGFLADGDLSPLRLMVVDAAASHRLTRCRVVLGGGVVAADADVSRISKGGVPAVWAGDLPREHGAFVESGMVSVVRSFSAPGRGSGVVEVASEAGSPASGWASGELRAGLGVISVGAMIGVLVVHRVVRRRLRPLEAIRGALRAVSAGDREPDALRIAPRFGSEAAAWNQLIDEHDRLRLEHTVRRAESGAAVAAEGADLLRNACDALWHGVVLVSEDRKVTYANGAAGVLLGVEREKLIGADAGDALGDAATGAGLASALSGSSRQRQTCEMRRGADGASVLRVGVRPLSGSDATKALVFIEDITQQRVADEARSSFVAQASHELRTPLTNIRLYVEALLDGASTDEQGRSTAINVINQEAQRLERIVSDMLSVSEIEAGAMQLRSDDVRLDAMFDELITDFAKQAEDKRIAMQFDLPPKWPVMRGDRDKIALALHNLVGNALKYTPPGGKVRVRVAPNERGDGVVIEVTDNGIGIKEEEQELVFEKFYRARDKRISSITGSGLGLTLARQVARMHHGDITLKSAPDKGSTFTMTLPLAA